LTQSITFCRRLKALGVDLIDCSSGACCLTRKSLLVGIPGPFAAAVRQEAQIATGLSLVTHPVQAEQIIATGQADAILMAREFYVSRTGRSMQPRS